MPSLRDPLHTRASPWCNDGVLRGCLRCLLPLPPSQDAQCGRFLVTFKDDSKLFAAACPIPLDQYPHVTLAHGGGGRLMHQLIEKCFIGAFGALNPESRHDAALLPRLTGRLAFTTDSYVVHPLFFPGGDIGSMAVHGTVNDLAMAGARPLYLSTGFILEEGLPMETLWRVVQSMQSAAAEAGVRIVTGDTKVVDRGKGDGLFINTAGVGVIEHDRIIAPVSVKPGDAILINGDLGRHGIAIMAVREGLEFETTIESDSASVSGTVQKLIDAGIEIHCLRDLTRGGLASTLNEIADATRTEICVKELAIAVREDVRGACEMLGFDPLYVANEGRFAAFIAASDAARALEILRADSPDSQASIIGSVVGPSDPGLVTLTSRIGANRVLDMLSGEQLPRIC
ncbi:MAG: hydrogenase expression/formation protein HypE [Candidatus Sumerlaeaceae bacterium]|nr:hydrogenase expression/formation protein HypE [Candidatus Sumerlaeaceae bacterium]